MRFIRFTALLSVVVAFPDSQSSERRGCPYTSSSTKETSRCPHSNIKAKGAMLRAWSRRAEDREGVFFMNRIAPGTSELYIADVDGSNERKLLGNQSRFDYHASFSPDGEWITFTTERNGDGNSVSPVL
jgi:dipeptidyl aminopeptidase/acylaminoacyl peptidase